MIDSQSIKTTGSGGVRGHDAGKRIKGRKRHIVTDTVGFLVGLAVHGADVRDRAGAPDLLKSIAAHCPLLRHLFADGGYAGPKLKGALEKIGRGRLQIVNRSDTAQGFEVVPRRWVVERTLAWLGRCRRMARDWEKTVASAAAWLIIAHIRRVTRLLARARHLDHNSESDSQTTKKRGGPQPGRADARRQKAPRAASDTTRWGTTAQPIMACDIGLRFLCQDET